MNPRLRLLASAIGAAATVVLAFHPPGAIAAREIEAPNLVPGESWRFSEREGYSRLELHRWRVELASSNASQTRLTVIGGPPDAEGACEERVFSAVGVLETGRLNGGVFGTFRPALQLPPFPLVEGRTWSQSVHRTAPSTDTDRTGNGPRRSRHVSNRDAARRVRMVHS